MLVSKAMEMFGLNWLLQVNQTLHDVPRKRCWTGRVEMDCFIVPYWFSEKELLSFRVLQELIED